MRKISLPRGFAGSDGKGTTVVFRLKEGRKFSADSDRDSDGPVNPFFSGDVPDPTRPLLGEQIPPFRRTAKHPSGPIKDRTRDASRCEDVLLLSLSFPDLSRLRQVGKGNCEETSQTLHIRGMHLPRPYTKFHYRIVNYFFIYLP